MVVELLLTHLTMLQLFMTRTHNFYTHNCYSIVKRWVSIVNLKSYTFFIVSVTIGWMPNQCFSLSFLSFKYSPLVDILFSFQVFFLSNVELLLNIEVYVLQEHLRQISTMKPLRVVAQELANYKAPMLFILEPWSWNITQLWISPMGILSTKLQALNNEWCTLLRAFHLVLSNK